MESRTITTNLYKDLQALIESARQQKLIKKDIDNLRKSNTLTPDFVFHDPCFLNFTGLSQDYSELNLENAILDELTKFIREFGNKKKPLKMGKLR